MPLTAGSWTATYPPTPTRVEANPGQINHRYGGRGVYFDDPDKHLFELMTAPYRP